MFKLNQKVISAFLFNVFFGALALLIFAVPNTTEAAEFCYQAVKKVNGILEYGECFDSIDDADLELGSNDGWISKRVKDGRLGGRK